MEETKVIKTDEIKIIKAEETNDINAETLMRLDLLNKQLAELLQVQRRVVMGYDYISASELAELLGEKMSTIYARVHNRVIPFYKPGGKILLFKLDEIREWIQSGRHATMEELRESI